MDELNTVSLSIAVIVMLMIFGFLRWLSRVTGATDPRMAQMYTSEGYSVLYLDGVFCISDNYQSVRQYVLEELPDDCIIEDYEDSVLVERMPVSQMRDMCGV